MDTAKTVLLTGATGFIGRETVLALVGVGWRVTKGYRSAGKAIVNGHIHLDLSEPATILALKREVRFDAIVHLGAHIGLSGTTESEMFVPNVLSTGCLAYLARLWDAPLIFASTAIVHGVKKETIEFDSPICPDTAYANSKWLGEQLLSASGSHYCVLRIAGVFGCGGPAHLGLNRAIDGAMRGEPPIQMGSGEAVRNYIYVKDVANAIVYALQERLEGTHLLAGHEGMRISRMLQEVCDLFLPGQQPVLKDGPEAMSQIIKPSTHMPRSRGFCQALTDIRKECPQ